MAMLYTYILYNDSWQKSMEMGNGAEGEVKERMGQVYTCA